MNVKAETLTDTKAVNSGINSNIIQQQIDTSQLHYMVKNHHDACVPGLTIVCLTCNLSSEPARTYMCKSPDIQGSS